MRVVRLVLAVALVLTVTPSSSGLPPDLAQPTAAVAIRFADGALLAWSPGMEAPDSYVVYGVRDGALSAPLATVAPDTMATVVSELFPSYAIAAVKDGVPSEATTTLTLSSSTPCTTIYTSPPGVYVGCTDKLPKAVGRLDLP